MTNTESRDTALNEGSKGGAAATKQRRSPRQANRAKGASKERPGARSKAGTGSRTARTQTGARSAKTAAAAPSTPSRTQSKGGQILALIGRAKGATLTEITQATSWQVHSVRGFLSTAAKKHNLKITSARNEAGERVYHTER